MTRSQTVKISKPTGHPADTQNPIAVFYRPEQNVPDNESFSPSAGKPRKFVERIQGHPGIEIRSDWVPLTRADLYTSHERAYVDDVLDGFQENGFGNRLKEVADSLPYTSGSLYHAAVHALDQGIALSPTSGFHHAKYHSGGAFCTFNGLTIAAQLLRSRDKVKKVGIVDFDCHYGNGTVDIIDHLDLKHIVHLTYGDHFHRFSGAASWLKALDKELEPFSKCGILIYQAGADPHRDDPLGGDLTTEEMLERDRIVFRFAKDRGIPIVWNLAGGYQQPFENVLDLHENTLKACLEVFRP